MNRTLSLLVKFAALDRLTEPLRRMGSGSQAAARGLAEARQQVSRLERAQSRIGAIREHTAAIERNHARLDANARRLRELRAQLEQTNGPTRQLTRSIAALSRENADITRSLERQTRGLDELRRDAREAGVDIDRLADEERRLGREMDRATDEMRRRRAEMERLQRLNERAARMSQRGQQLQGAGATGLVAGAAVLGAVSMTAKPAVEFETSMAKVRRLVDGMEDPRALREMNRQILQLSTQLPISAAGIAEIVAAGGAAGIARQDVINFARDAAKMAVAFDEMTPDQAGETMAKWRTGFELTQTEVVSLADKVNYLADKTAAAPEVIADIVTRVGPLGRVAGIASGEISALGATLNSVGVSGENAATGIKNTLLGLTKGEAATKSQNKAFKALGLEAENVAKAMQVDARGTLLDVFTRLSKLSPDRQLSVLDQLFGSESVSAIAPLLSNLDKLRKNLDLVGKSGEYAGSMTAEFNNQNGTSASQLLRFNNQVLRLKILLGESVLPFLIACAEWLGRIADRVSAWTERHPRLTAALTTAVAILGVLLVVCGALAITIGTILGPIGMLGLFLGQAGAGGSLFARGIAVLRGAFVMLGKPIGWILRILMVAIGAIAAFFGIPVWAAAAAIAAIAAIGYAIYANWDAIKTGAGQLWEWLKGKFNAGIAWFIGLHVRFVQVGVNLVRGIINGIGSMFGALKAKIIALGKNAVGWFKGVLGIKSPSRVFAGLGGHMMGGLALGLDRAAGRPLARVKAIGRDLTGAAAAAITVSTPAPAAGRGGTAPPAAASYVFNITQLPGESGEDLARRVTRMLDDRDRAQATAWRGTYEDVD